MAGTAGALIQVKSTTPVELQAGERLRLYITAGPGTGHGYCLTGDRIYIGRDPSCEIQIVDPSLSRRHAELVWTNNQYQIVDLDSANGIRVNRAVKKLWTIKPGDQLVIGACVFEVLAPGGLLRKGAAALASGKLLSDAEQKKVQKSRMMVGVGLLFLLMIAFSANEDGVQTLRDRGRLPPSDEGEAKPKKLKKTELQKALKDFIPMQSGSDTPQRKQADVFYKAAMREYRYKNYLRAISAFETTLTIDPTFELARIQMKVAKAEMEKDIDLMYRRSVEDRKALRYRSACLNLKDVMNALEADQTAELYKKADDDLKKMKADGQCDD